jgi:HNH endonuclease
MAKSGYPARPVADRFWEKVNRNGPVPPQDPALGPCWVWTAGINDKRGGYGMFALRKGVIRRSHRIAWELANNEPVPDGLWVLHRCDNPPCCNPAHLFLGTPKENTADMATKGRDGFPGPGSAHPSARLTEADVLAIRASRLAGVTGAELGRRYGVHRSTIYHLCSDRWTHV